MRIHWLTVVLVSMLSAGDPGGGAAERPASIPSEAGLPSTPASPTALAIASDGRRLYAACATANQVVTVDTVLNRVVDRIDVPASPLGLALSKDDARLYVACAAPVSTICVIDLAANRISAQIPAGHTAMAPVLSPDGVTLYVCNRFDDDVSVIDLTAGREVRRIRVEREPVAAAVTPNGKLLIIANHLHAGSADNFRAEAVVSLIDTGTGRITRNLGLTEGAGLVRGVAVSPDGRFAAATFVRGRYWLATTEVDLGRINANAIAVVDLENLKVLGILFLDQMARGAANPWAVSWTPDGSTILVTHTGINEVSVIDAPVEADPASFFSIRLSDYEGNRGAPPAPRHPVRVRRRLPLPGIGPRAIAVSGSHLFVANYFSDDLCRVDLEDPETPAERLVLSSVAEPSVVRRGEMLFNDARICRQGWQSCASCHDTDGRTDAFNWDLLNDGLNNPKNTRSLLWAHRTPPVMSLGVRDSAETAVRAGLRHILFAEQTEEAAVAIDAYLRALQPIPSPILGDPHLAGAVDRGRVLFMGSRTGCVGCHPPPLFTDLATHDVGTAGRYGGLLGVLATDGPNGQFDTPTLVETWRTAPYLHNGSAASLRDVLTNRNPEDRHGRTSGLSPDEIGDLVSFLLSL